MLIQEFVDRTGYIPTEKEWEHVNSAYMDCEVDKDEFCKLADRKNGIAGRVHTQRGA